jgi:aminoglycoside 2''-phosphotransferase
MNEFKELILRARRDFSVDSIEFLGEGDFCRAFLVNRRTVFRFSKHEPARAALRRENCLLPQIKRAVSLQIPQPEFACLNGGAEESFIAYPFLIDSALTAEKYLMLGERARTRCAGQVADFLGELHAVDLSTARNCGVLNEEAGDKYRVWLDKLHDFKGGAFSAADFDFARNEIERYYESVEREPFAPVLLHGDLSPDHVLYDGGRVTAIIDFGDLMIGDPARDFLWIYEDYGIDFFRRALAKYTFADKTSFAGRVQRLSNLEALGWIAESLENGEKDSGEAQEHLKSLRAAADQAIF